MAAVEIRSVTKSWGGAPAVNDVSFTVEAGRLCAILGPSGCGKSTTLRLVAGLDQASSGRIFIDGRDVTDLPPAGRGVSMVFQSYALFPHLSVRENILFGLKVRKVAPAEQATRLERAVGILGLAALLDRKPSQLSGGQQQRVALGRAIVAQTPVCLMDEPLSNLDAQLRVEMRREIRELQKRLGITMLYVTHDQIEAMTMADQVVLMKDGRIEQDGPPADLYEQPATTFVARFVGMPPMNVLSLDAVTGAGGSPDGAPAGRAGLALGIRPEMIAIGETGARARVIAAEFLGADTLIEALLGGEAVIIRRPGKVAVQAGDEIALSWEARTAFWFDKTSGARLMAPQG